MPYQVSRPNQSDGSGRYFGELISEAAWGAVAPTPPFDLWPYYATTTFQPGVQTAGAASIVSSSAADAAAGTGARTVLLRGLDADYYQRTETVTMNGATPVLTARTDWIWIQDAVVRTVGTGGGPAGDIDISIGGVVIQRCASNHLANTSARWVQPVNFGQSLITGIASLGVYGGINETRVGIQIIHQDFAGLLTAQAHFSANSAGGPVQVGTRKLWGINPGESMFVRVNSVNGTNANVMVGVQFGDGIR